MKPAILFLSGLSITLIISRLAPHAPNFTATLATFIFSAMVLRKSYYWIILIAAYWLSDLVLNNILYTKSEFTWFTSGIEYLMITYAIIYFMLIKFAKQEPRPIPVFFTTMGSSIFFFIISNFGVWLNSTLYSNDWTGLLTCYIAALPFFGNEIAGTLFYSSVFFSAYWLMIPNFQTNEVRSESTLRGASKN